MALSLATVTNSIAAISVTGVTFRDVDEIPVDVTERDAPMIIPRPDGFVSNFRPSRETYGSGSGAKWNVTYNLRYLLLHSQIGTGRSNIFDTYADMVDKAMAFVDAVIADDALTGCVDITLEDISDFGPVQAPTGTTFHGCEFVFSVLEFQDG